MINRFFMQFGLFSDQKPVAQVNVKQESCPLLQKIWLDLQCEFFPECDRLTQYRTIWSRRRQKRTLASCYFESKRIIVAKELKHSQFHHWLAPLLYHEMCHAVIGIKPPRRNGKNCWHGREFKELEACHPEMEAFNRWVKQGGWAHAVRSERARSAALHRSRQKSRKTTINSN